MIDCKAQFCILKKEASKKALFVAKIKFYTDFFLYSRLISGILARVEFKAFKL